MFEDDPLIKPQAELEDMSTDDLRALITSLEAEIERCRAEIARKEAHRKAADDIFGGGG